MAGAPKKLVDKWKAKAWYAVVAPKFLNEAKVTEVPATDDERLLNRVLILPLKEITRNLQHMNVNVKLRVVEIKGRTAYTKFIGHEVAREYIRTLVRRGRNVLDIVFPAVSKDGVEFKVKAVVITTNKASGSQKKSLRRQFVDLAKARIAKQDFGDFILDALYNKVSLEAHNQLKKIVPIYRVEVRKTELKEVFDVDAAANPEEHAKKLRAELDQQDEDAKTARAATTESETPAEEEPQANTA